MGDRFKLVEVKSQRDRLSGQQRAWLRELSTALNICVEVCHVVEGECAEETKTKRQKKMEKEQEVEEKATEEEEYNAFFNDD